VSFEASAQYQYDDLVAITSGAPRFIPIALNLDVNALLSTNGVQSAAEATLRLSVRIFQEFRGEELTTHSLLIVDTATLPTLEATSSVDRSGPSSSLDSPAAWRARGESAGLGRQNSPDYISRVRYLYRSSVWTGSVLGSRRLCLKLGVSYSLPRLRELRRLAQRAVSDLGAGVHSADGVTVSSAQAKITNNRFVGGVVADTTPPTTTATPSPNPNASGWNNTNVAVTLNATDNPGGSGVKEIQFSLNGAQSGAGLVSGGVASVPIAAEGTTTLTYFARDNANNAEAPKTLPVQIDKTPPTVTFASPTPRQMRRAGTTAMFRSHSPRPTVFLDSPPRRRRVRWSSRLRARALHRASR